MPNSLKIKSIYTSLSQRLSQRSPRITLSSCRGMSKDSKIHRRYQRRLCTNGFIFRAPCGYQVLQSLPRHQYVWARLTQKDLICSASFVARETVALVSNVSIADAWFHSILSVRGEPTTSSRSNAWIDRATIVSSARSIVLWRSCARWKIRISRLLRRYRSSARLSIAV